MLFIVLMFQLKVINEFSCQDQNKNIRVHIPKGFGFHSSPGWLHAVPDLDAAHALVLPLDHAAFSKDGE